MPQEKNKTEDDSSSLHDKLRHVLTEARMVLPGAQALLGFQFVTMLMNDFDRLPTSSKYAHLASLLLITVTVILLMTPAAYHRVVEHGETTDDFYRLAGRLVLSAMIPLALGISGDFFVVVRKTSGSVTLAVSSTVALLVLFFGLWFGYSAYRRKRGQGSRLVKQA